MRIAIIPARGGSRRIPRKNIRPFHGKPIIAYSIEAACDYWGLIDEVYVSSDDDEILDIAVSYRAKPIKRPPELAVDKVGTQAVMRHALTMMPKDKEYVHYACCIYPCAPLLRSQDLRHSYYVMRATGRYVYVPGWYYWGDAAWFKAGRSLDEGIRLECEPWRYVDINTEDDWQRAERMYAELHREAA